VPSALSTAEAAVHQQAAVVVGHLQAGGGAAHMGFRKIIFGVVEFGRVVLQIDPAVRGAYAHGLRVNVDVAQQFQFLFRAIEAGAVRLHSQLVPFDQHVTAEDAEIARRVFNLLRTDAGFLLLIRGKRFRWFIPVLFGSGCRALLPGIGAGSDIGCGPGRKGCQ